MIGVRHDHGPGGQSQHVMSLGIRRDMVAACNHMLEFRRLTDWLAFRYPQFRFATAATGRLVPIRSKMPPEKHDALLEW